MIKRALWTTTATLALLSASSFFATEAFAQKGVLLQPQTAWAVTNVGEDTSDPYCAIARRFRQNLIVTMAENQRGQASVALDFRDGYFKTGKTYDVTLDPGAGEERMFQLKPISAQAFVVRLGSDEAFFRALNQTGYMRLEINSQMYNLNLADIEKGRATLNACLGNLKSADGATRARPSQEMSDISSRLEKLERENTKLRANIEPAAGESKKDKPSYLIGGAAEVAPMKALPTTASAAGGNLDVLVSRLEDLETKNARLERELEAQRVDVGREYSADLKRLELENKALQGVLAENAQSAGIAKTLESKLLAIEEENQTLQAKTADLTKLRAEISVLSEENASLMKTAERIAVLENELRLARVEKESLSESANGAESVAKELEAQTVSLQEQVASLRTMNAEFEADLAAQSNKQKALSDKLAAAARENESLQASIEASAQGEKEQQGFLAKLQDQVQSLTSEKSDLKGSVAALNDDLDALKQANADLLAAQGSMNLLKADNQDYQAQVAALEDAKSELQAKLDENKTLNIRLSGDKDALEALIAEKESKNEALLSELQSKLQSNLADTAKKDAKAQESLAALKAENKDLMGKLAEAHGAQDAALALEDKLATLDADNKSLRTAHTGQSEELAALQKNFSALEADNRQLALRLEEAQGAQARAEEQLAALKVERDALKSQVASVMGERDALEEKVANIQTERNEMKRDVASLSDERDALQDKVAAVESKRDALEDKLTALSHKTAGSDKAVAALRAEKKDMKADIAALTSERTALQKEIASIDSDRKALRNQIAGVESDRDELVADVAAIKMEREDMKASLSSVAGERDELLGKISKIESKRSTLESQLAALSAKTEGSKKTVFALKAEKDSMRADIKALTDERNSIQAKLEGTQAKADALEIGAAADKIEKKSLKDQLAKAKAAQNTLELAIADLRSQNDSLAEQLQIARADVASDDETVAALQGKLASLQARNKDLTAELAQQKLAYVQLEQVVTPMKAESVGLKRELKALSVKFHKMQTQLDQRDAMLKATVAKTTSETASLAPIERVVQAAVSGTPKAAQAPVPSVVAIEPAAGDEARKVVPTKAIDEDTGIVVNNNGLAPAPRFKNSAQDMERGLVSTIRETEAGFEEVAKRPAQTPDIEVEVVETLEETVVEAPKVDVPKAEAPVARVEPAAEAPAPAPVGIEEPRSVMSAHEEAVESTKSLLEETGIRRRDTAKEMAFAPPTNVKPKPVIISKVQPDAPIAPAVTPVKVAPKPQPIVLAPAAPRYYQSPVDLAGVLNRANVNYGGQINRVDNHSSADVVSYQWQGSNGLYGSAQQKPMRATAEFDAFMQVYLDKTKSRCAGDFAIVPSASSMSGVDRMESYEVACVGSGADSAASVLFFSQNGTFTALAHETPTANMQTAMDVRDQIMKSVSGS